MGERAVQEGICRGVGLSKVLWGCGLRVCDEYLANRGLPGRLDLGLIS